MKHWYLLAYDIRDNRRSQRFHKILKRKGLPMQGSVFLIRTDHQGLITLKQEVTQTTNTLEDDIRLYPLRHPDELWLAGQQQKSLQGIYSGKRKQSISGRILNRLHQLLKGDSC